MKNIKKYIPLIIVLVIAGLGFAFRENIARAVRGDAYVDNKIFTKQLEKAQKSGKDAFPQLSDKVAKDEAEVILHTSKGDITVKLFPTLAPKASENFLKHAKDKYYDGLTFHRVIKDFMVQSGDPKGDGTGGESIWKKGFAVEPTPFLYNIRGALAMANTGAKESNGSQFMRLKDMNLLDMLIAKTVQLALEKGIIKSKSIIVDATHTKSRYNQKTPRQVLQKQSKKLRRSIYEIDETMKEKFPDKNTEDSLEKELKYCKQLIDVVKGNEEICSYPKVQEKLNLLEESVTDDMEHLEISKDEDAKTGHKTADTSFFGYKTHIAMTEERIITAATITSGEKMCIRDR